MKAMVKQTVMGILTGSFILGTAMTVSAHGPSGNHGYGGGYGHHSHGGSAYHGGSYNYGHLNGNLGSGYYPPPVMPTWHNTSHYDYQPGQYVPHGGHFHYVPGHTHFHQTGHWHQ